MERKVVWAIMAVFFAGLLSNAALAQNIKRYEMFNGYEGSLTLWNDSTIEGKLKYEYLANRVIVTSGNKKAMYDHNEIKNFHLSFSKLDPKIQFKSLDLPLGNQIYEVIGEDGEKAILAIQHDSFDRNSMLNMSNSESNAKNKPFVTFNKYFFTKTFFMIDNLGNVEEIGTVVASEKKEGKLKTSISRKRLISTLEKFNPEIETFISENELNLKSTNHLMAALGSIFNEKKQFP